MREIETKASAENIHRAKVAGSGGRPRTIWTGCAHDCHHGSYRQAVKCVERYNAAVEKRAAK